MDLFTKHQHILFGNNETGDPNMPRIIPLSSSSAVRCPYLLVRAKMSISADEIMLMSEIQKGSLSYDFTKCL